MLILISSPGFVPQSVDLVPVGTPPAGPPVVSSPTVGPPSVLPPSPPVAPPPRNVYATIPGNQKIKLDTNRTGDPLRPNETRVYRWDVIDTANRWPSKIEMAPSGAAGSTRILSITSAGQAYPITGPIGSAFAGSDLLVGNDPRSAGIKLPTGTAYVTVTDTGRGGDFVLELDNS